MQTMCEVAGAFCLVGTGLAAVVYAVSNSLTLGNWMLTVYRENKRLKRIVDAQEKSK